MYWSELPEEAKVHWDRDGMSDLIATLEPHVPYDEGRPRFNRVGPNGGYKYFMFYGNAGYIRAVYVVNPVAHWRNLYTGEDPLRAGRSASTNPFSWAKNG